MTGHGECGSRLSLVPRLLPFHRSPLCSPKNSSLSLSTCACIVMPLEWSSFTTIGVAQCMCVGAWWLVKRGGTLAHLIRRDRCCIPNIPAFVYIYPHGFSGHDSYNDTRLDRSVRSHTSAPLPCPFLTPCRLSAPRRNTATALSSQRLSNV
jgi:hypothetical protein